MAITSRCRSRRAPMWHDEPPTKPGQSAPSAARFSQSGRWAQCRRGLCSSRIRAANPPSTENERRCTSLARSNTRQRPAAGVDYMCRSVSGSTEVTDDARLRRTSPISLEVHMSRADRTTVASACPVVCWFAYHGCGANSFAPDSAAFNGRSGVRHANDGRS